MDILSVETLPDYPAFLQIRSALWRRGEVNGAAAMVGAGFSRFADLVTGTTPLPPLWSDLTAAMKDELCLNDDTTSDALTLAEEYRVELGTIALENLIRSQVRNDELNPGNFHRRLLSLPWADVLTTNWDTLLERSVEDNPDLPYDVVLTSSDIPLKRSPRIVKLHGSLPSHGPFILTREDFRTYPTRFAPFANLARQVLLENELCLIGFSGDDPNFLEWSGWVRDQLGDAARPIRLLGNLGVSNSRRRLLNSRNVTPIDLYPLVKDVPAKDQHRRATEIIIKFFEDGKPRKTKWNFSSAGENVKNSSDSDSTLTTLTKAWATERKNHPGWLVTPSSVRTELWNASNSCIDVLEKNLKAATKSVKAAILYEAIWRWETAFWPLPEFIACAASNLVAADEDNSLSLKQQTFLRTAIVRDSRHRRDWSTFEVGIHSLEQLNDPDATLEAIYERCLKAQDEFEYEFVATHVDQITGTDPIWLLRRAALEVDVMDSREVIKLIHEAYRQIRRRRAQSPRSIWLISREAWALWLARLARFESELSALDEQRGWPHAYRDYETDPWDEIQKIEHQITWEEQQGLGNLCTRQPKFDAGAYRLTFRGRINPVHRPHNDLIRIMECVGIPFRFTYVDLFGSRFARALRTLEQSGTIDAFERVRGAIATDVKSVENHFSRVSVARLPLTDVNVCVQNIKRGIEFGKRKIMRLPSDQAKNECLFWTNRVCEMIELLSRLSMRLQGNDALNIVRFGTAVSRELITDCPRIFERLENLVFRGLHAVEPSQHQKIALDILQLPLHSELGSSFSSTSNWFKVIAAINQDAWRVRNEPSEGLEKAKWSARISFLISVVSGREPSVFRCSAGFRASATALPGSGGVHFELERGRLRFRRPVFQRWRRLSGVPEQAPPPAAPRPAGISGRAPLRRRVCAVPAAAARGRAGSARAGGCWRRGWRGRWPARTGPGRAAAPGRGRGAPGR